MKRPKHRKRSLAALLLLAVLCIGGVELAACSYFDPALFAAITAPARRAAHAAAQTCAGLYRGACAAVELAAQSAADYTAQLTDYTAKLLASLTPPEPEPEPDGQLAGEPYITAADPSPHPITELRQVDGRQLLTGGTVDIVYFNQADPEWADQPYGSDDIGRYGCGPTAMAMVVASLTGEQTDPAAMAQWAVANGHWASGSGSYHSIVAGAARAFGLQVETPVERTADALRQALSENKLLVALMRPGHFTKVGHFILLRGITPSGDIMVADPNSTERSLTAWDPQLILDELGGSNSSGAPLWAVSLPDP